MRWFCASALIGLLSVVVSGGTRVAAQDFGGAYAGVHAGYRFGDADFSAPAYSFVDDTGATVDVPIQSNSIELNSPLAGAHAGYNLLIGPNFLIGVEVDVSAAGGTWRGASNSATQNTIIVDSDDEVEIVVARAAILNSSLELGIQGSVRGRAGYVLGSTMFYATAGVAFLRSEWSQALTISSGESATVSHDDILTGWVVGGGFESFLGPNVVGRVEYLYEDFGSTSVPLPFTTSRGTLDVSAQKLRAGLSVFF